MRRVVVTGLGLVSPIGNTLAEVEHNLRNGVSGVTLNDEFVKMGFAACNKGSVKNFVMPEVDKDTKRQLGIGNELRYSHASTQLAVDDAGLTPADLFAAGVLFGQGGASTIDIYEVGRLTVEKGRPYAPVANAVTPTMSSGCSAEIATHFRNGAMNYGVSAACATGNFAIGLGARHVALGDTPIMICGAGDATDWVMSAPFDRLQAMTRNKDFAPEQASRPFDKQRSGFVVGEGAGTLVLEDLDHAKARGAKIYCEVAGFGFSSDGKGEPTDPDKDGAMRGMLNALRGLDGSQTIDASRIGYVKAHGTSTAKGDDNELNAISEAFLSRGCRVPRIGSTKSLTGHALGGAGAIESIFSILMMQGNFLAPSINIDDPSDVAKELRLEENLLRTGVSNIELDMVLANSFGFGGTNASLVFARYN